MNACGRESVLLDCIATEKFTLGIEAKTMWEGHGLGNLAKVGQWRLGGQPISKSLKAINLNATARGKLSDQHKAMVEEGARRSPVHHIFSSGKQVKTTFKYVA